MTKNLCAYGATPPYTDACESAAVRDGLCANHANAADFFAAMQAEQEAWEEEHGACDCGAVYELADRAFHCGDCGTCWDHCKCDARNNVMA